LRGRTGPGTRFPVAFMCEIETEIVLTYLFIIIFIYWRITADPTEELLASQVKLCGRGPAGLSPVG
jgi:hypothetical protein